MSLLSPVRTLRDVEALLAQTTNYEEKMPRVEPGGDGVARPFDLTRMAGLLADLGHPELGPRTAHVTGSKGKGSTCRMLEAVLVAAGRGRVGLYTSPHVESLCERVSLDARPVEEAPLVAAVEAMRPALLAREGTPGYPTFFELLTAAAHLVFRAAGCADVVLEVGLGGRLDATNVCRPSATAVTTVELEHTAVLGDSLEKIAAEKAGIVKPGVPMVTALPLDGPALGVLAAACAAAGAPLFRVGREIVVTEVDARPGPALSLTVAGPLGAPPLRVTLPVAGRHQAGNAAVAVGLARLLGVGDAALVAGLSRVALPATVEPVRVGDPSSPRTVVVDGAHTPASVRATRDAVTACFPHRRLVLVLGVLAEKDVRGIVRAAVPGAARVVACGVPSPRALAPRALAEAVREVAGTTPVDVEDDAAAALRRALVDAGEDDLVLVTGSLYLAGAARAALRQRLEGMPQGGTSGSVSSIRK